MTETSAIDRINELARKLVDARIQQAKADPEQQKHMEGYKFIAMISGQDVSDAAQAEAMLKDPMTMISATMVYLEEQRTGVLFK